MIKKLVAITIFGLVVSLSSFFLSRAQTNSIVDEAQINFNDLGIENPGILPTNPFYFLKEWGRTIKVFFNFNQKSKIEIQIQDLNERAAELKKLEDLKPDDTKDILKALNGYNENVDQLKKRLDALGVGGKNQDINELIDKLTENSLKHQELFDDLKQKFYDKEDVKNNLDAVQNKVNRLFNDVSQNFGGPTIFKKRLAKAVLDNNGGVLKNIRDAEILNLISEKLPDDSRQKIKELRGVLLEKIQSNVEKLNKEDRAKIFDPEILKQLPGDKFSRIEILDELKNKINDEDFSGNIQKFSSSILEEKMQNNEVSKEAVQELIKETNEIISEVNSGIDSISNPDLKAKTINALNMAEAELDEVIADLAGGKIGDAFGKVTTAYSHAKDAKSWLEGEFGVNKENPTSTNGGNQSGNESDINNKILCTEVYDPVCGVNARTYPNSCYAERAHAKILYKGICKEDVKSPPEQN